MGRTDQSGSLMRRESIAAPLIGVMAPRALSQTIQMLTSPPLLWTAKVLSVEWVGGNKVIGLPAPFSMTHHENKSAGGLNYHIHLSSALSDVVLERSPDQQQACG